MKIQIFFSNISTYDQIIPELVQETTQFPERNEQKVAEELRSPERQGLWSPAAASQVQATRIIKGYRVINVTKLGMDRFKCDRNFAEL